MSNIITTPDLRACYAAWVAAADRQGLLPAAGPASVRLVIGSQVYGNPFAVVQVDPDTGAQRTMIWLGMTKRDAVDVLRRHVDALAAVSYGCY